MITLTISGLQALQASATPFELIDVRRAVARRKQGGDIPGGRWLDPETVLTWKDDLPIGARRIVYCAHGHEISQGIAALLRAMGHDVLHLEGGYTAWQTSGAPIAALPQRTRWVTRERPKIDRIACPWLIKRFIDVHAEFLYVPADQVLAVAEREGATPYDIPGVAYSHVGERCSFDAFIERHQLNDAPLQQLATIVRGADTDRHELAPQCAGLLAVSLGLSAQHADDQACLAAGLPVYDALYAWCRSAQGERHHWAPPAGGGLGGA
ncbi:MAG: chromate resistance protein [Ideonella sp.]|nr:chromate resistance protein [Ideonella sp.]